MSIQGLLPLLWMLVLLHILVTWWTSVHRGRRERETNVQQPVPLPEQLPAVSVIIPAWNECGTLERCIDALRRVDYPCWEAVILAGGDDSTFAVACQAVAADSRWRVLERGPEPKNAVLTRGVQAARYDTLVLLDADNIVQPGWLRVLVAPLAEGASATVGDRLPNQWTWVTKAELMRSIREYQILRVFRIQGDRSIAIRREMLEKAGGLPVHTFAREDWDLGVRLEEAGARVVFAKGAILLTDRPATLKEAWRDQVRWHRTHLTGMWEHRATLIYRPAQAFNQLYGYILSLGVSLGAIAALALLAAWPAARPVVLQLVLLTSAWLYLRRAALGAEIAAFTGEQAWLLRSWMPVATMVIEMGASVVALLSLGKQTHLYKGPRHAHA